MNFALVYYLKGNNNFHIDRMIIFIFLALITIVHAFNEVHPTFIDNGSSYFVSMVEEIPKQFQAMKKQQTIGLLPNTTISESPSSTASIQTETMTAGMTYLNPTSKDEAFSVNITINAKDYPVLLDTGSPYLWLYASNCTDNSCLGKDNFDSSKAHELNGTFALSYDSGIASGHIYEDSIIIGGFETHDYKFGVADHVPDLFEPYQFSGVLGLPADNSSSTGLVNAISFLFENGDIRQSKFTICIGEYESERDNSGLLFFGETKEQLHEGEIYTSPLIEEAVSHWEFKIDSVYVNDYQITFDSLKIDQENSTTSRIGLLDSGTTSLILSTSDATKIHSFFEDSITDGQNFAIYCNSTLEFEIEISGKNWTLTPDMYISSAYPSNGDLSGYCVSSIQGINFTEDGAWILGILFMKDKYVEFDYENQWIGLAERNNNLKFVEAPKSTAPVPTASTTITTSSSIAATAISTISSVKNDAYSQKSQRQWIFPFILSLLAY